MKRNIETHHLHLLQFPFCPGALSTLLDCMSTNSLSCSIQWGDRYSGR